MPTVRKILEQMRSNPVNVRFDDADKVCRLYFGVPRIHGSHHVFCTPWKGDPRINIQNRNGFVARYQVIQILKAIDALEAQQ